MTGGLWSTGKGCAMCDYGKTLKKRTGRIIPTKERAKVLWRRPGRSKGLKRRKAYRPPRKQHADGAEIAVSLSTVDVGEKIWPSGGGH